MLVWYSRLGRFRPRLVSMLVTLLKVNVSIVSHDESCGLFLHSFYLSISFLVYGDQTVY